MNPALAELKDIHLPPSLPWWDMGVGWWVILVLLGLALLLLAYQFKRIQAKYSQIQHKKALKQAISDELDNISNAFAENKQHQLLLSHLSSFLRRVCLQAFPKQAVAGLIAKDWCAFLDKAWVENNDDYSFSQPYLINLLQYAAYQADFDQEMQENSEKLLKISQQWAKEVIKHHV